MTDRAGVGVDLKIVATGEALVTEEVDGLVLDAGNILLGLDVLQAVSLVPTGGEDIEGDLAADGVAVAERWLKLNIHGVYRSVDANLRETIVGELLLQGFDHIPTDVVDLIITKSIVSRNVPACPAISASIAGSSGVNIRLELIPLLHAGITSNGADIDHAISELNESTTLPGQLDVGNITKAEIGEILVLLLAEPLNEAVAVQRLAQAPGHEAVLGETEIEQAGDFGGSIAQLLLLLNVVGAADLNGVFQLDSTEDGRGGWEEARTYPMAHLCRNRESNSCISGVAD